jgi:hypothetical protein
MNFGNFESVDELKENPMKFLIEIEVARIFVEISVTQTSQEELASAVRPTN